MNLAWMFNYTPFLWWLGVLSIMTFIGTLIVIPILVIRIPAHYFMYDEQWRLPAPKTPITIRLLGLICKNLIGLVFVLAGLIMLVLPGQGIITILIGLMLMNFPGKRTLERRLVQQPAVLRALNWMRAKADQPPLVVPTADVAAKTVPKTDT